MKRFFPFLSLLALLPLKAQAQRFPYHSAVFFHDCAHLRDARHNESNDDLVNDISCARYIEGFEMAYIEAKGLPETCLADPLSIFEIAEERFRGDPHPDDMPTRYLSSAILARCNHSENR